MSFEDFEAEQFARDLWSQIHIVRPVHYRLFTFGTSDLPYILVLEPNPTSDSRLVSIKRGEVSISRAAILTPDNVEPEFLNFFEGQDEHEMARFLLARTASFPHMKFQNQVGHSEIVSDSVEEVVTKLNRQLDEEDEDRVTIITAPIQFAGLAILKLALEKIYESTPENLQELREKGFLPE